jgi:hypothetical protein
MRSSERRMAGGIKLRMKLISRMAINVTNVRESRFIYIIYLVVELIFILAHMQHLLTPKQ